MLALESALGVWEGVDIEDVRAKSLALTDFFLECVAAYVPEGKVEPVTPAGHGERGSQVSLRTANAREVMTELIARGSSGTSAPPMSCASDSPRSTSVSPTRNAPPARWVTFSGDAVAKRHCDGRAGLRLRPLPFRPVRPRDGGFQPDTVPLWRNTGTSVPAVPRVTERLSR